MNGTQLWNQDLLLIEVFPLALLRLLRGGWQGDALTIHVSARKRIQEISPLRNTYMRVKNIPWGEKVESCRGVIDV